ncbi:MAG: 23S rRNA (guanosine-2'-O-)-methyltransferase RlmB [Chlamydiae bacterium]|nr:23S rRNA (guanosine-2'-O-)-methyltransferase RlmB [Chlamydiota bacterium]
MLPKKILSLQHPIVKNFVKLRENRKWRHEMGRVVISGWKQITEAKKVDILLTEKGKPLPEVEANQIYFVTDAILKKVTGLLAPEPYAATIEIPAQSTLAQKRWILCLDGVSDPGNLGTLLRSALALGWEGAFLLDSCDPYNEKALRAAKGATFRLPLRMGTLLSLFDLIETEDLIPRIAAPTGEPLQNLPKQENCLLILGNEASGVRPELKETFPSLSIPIIGIESLNVAAAGAILLYTLKK